MDLGSGISEQQKQLLPELHDKLNALENAIIKEKQLLNWIKDRLDDNPTITDTLHKYLRVKLLQP